MPVQWRLTSLALMDHPTVFDENSARIGRLTAAFRALPRPGPGVLIDGTYPTPGDLTGHLFEQLTPSVVRVRPGPVPDLVLAIT